MSDLIKTVLKYTFGKKLFVAMIFIIVFFSTVFCVYTFRFGIAFGYDSIMTDDGLFSYSFSGHNKDILNDGDFTEYFDKSVFVSSSYYYNDYENTITAGNYTVVRNLYKISTTDDIKKYPGVEKYISERDVLNQNKFIIMSRFDVNYSDKQIDIGKTILVNGVEYIVVGVDDFTDENGYSYTNIIVDSDELRATYDSVNYVVYTNKEVSNRELKKIAASAGLKANLPDKEKYIYGFLVLSFAVCALFMVNLVILFNAFVKANDKFYTVFKILGIRKLKLTLIMSLPSVIIALFSSIVGILCDYALANAGTILDKHVYLTVGGVAATILINTFGAFTGTAVSCYRQAKCVPAESLTRVQ